MKLATSILVATMIGLGMYCSPAHAAPPAPQVGDMFYFNDGSVLRAENPTPHGKSCWRSIVVGSDRPCHWINLPREPADGTWWILHGKPQFDPK
jgi:hypothetical protein